RRHSDQPWTPPLPLVRRRIPSLLIRTEWPHRLCLELLDRRLDGAEVGPAQRVDEVGTGQAGDLRALALRNQPTVVPEDRRGRPKLLCEWIVRTCNRQRRVV